MAASSEIATLDCSAECPVLHVLLIGFHHQKGSTVEYCFPGLSNQSGTTNMAPNLPAEWRALPHLALPDGCHNYTEGHVRFRLPPLPATGDSHTHCVSCFQQISSHELDPSLVGANEITRSTIQKAICVICKWPLYDFLKSNLQTAIQTYFSAKDFTDHSLIHHTYTELNSQLDKTTALKLCRHSDTLPWQLSHYKHRLLQLFKAVLLEKKVMIYGQDSSVVSSVVTSLGSILPLYYESLIQPSLITPNEQGLPLRTFPTHSSFQPYLSLQQMDTLLTAINQETGGRGFLVGVVNPLYYKQCKQSFDVCFVTDSKCMEIHDKDLSDCLHLTTADLRFCNLLEQGSSECSDGHDVTAEAESDWSTATGESIQLHFKCYLLSLLSTSLNGDSFSFDDHNHQFVKSFLKTSIYSRWVESSPSNLGAEPHHICEADTSLSDLKHHLMMRADEYGLSVDTDKVDQLVQKTGIYYTMGTIHFIITLSFCVESFIETTKAQVQATVSTLWNHTSSTLVNWWNSTDSTSHDNSD